jgi:hypothetical protein
MLGESLLVIATYFFDLTLYHADFCFQIFIIHAHVVDVVVLEILFVLPKHLFYCL